VTCLHPAHTYLHPQHGCMDCLLAVQHRIVCPAEETEGHRWRKKRYGTVRGNRPVKPARKPR
jgi:hypothetical protein